MSAAKPMLAATLESLDEGVYYPILASPKLDGIRCLVQGGKALSRTGKPIPNVAASAYLAALPLEGLDGELMVHSVDFQTVTSMFMSRNTALPAGWYFGVFDALPVRAGEPYSERLARVTARIAALPEGARRHIVLVPHVIVSDRAELEAFEANAIKSGFEGVMLSRPSAAYKHGRSTLREGALVKWKRFADAEAVVIGSQQLETAAGLVDGLGALCVRDVVTGCEFEIGTGFTAAQRSQLWRDRNGSLLGRVVKYRHFALSGVKDKPRFPSFIGFRAAEDM
jgi:DNA ligase-1